MHVPDHNSVLLDTNIFLRVFVKENEKTYSECLKVIKAISNEAVTGFTTSLVLAEIHYVLLTVYHRSRSEIADSLMSVVSTPRLFIIDDADVSLAVKYYQSTNVKFTDCLIASSKKVQRGEAAIVSYDREFNKLKVKRLEPGQLLKKLPK